MSKVSKIIKRLENNTLSRETDEKYNGGFWDLAGELTDNEEAQEELYYIFYEIYERTKKMKKEQEEHHKDDEEYYELNLYTDKGEIIITKEEIYPELAEIKEYIKDRYTKAKIDKIVMPSNDIIEVYYNKDKQKLTDVIRITKICKIIQNLKDIKEVIENEKTKESN